VSDNRDNLDAVGEEQDPVAALSREFRRLRRRLGLDLRVSAPAHVVSYDSVTNTADLMLGFRPVEEVEGQQVVMPPEPLQNVPVVLLGGAAGHLSVPILTGDTGLVIFTDRCLDLWRIRGTPTDPGNRRVHNKADAVFLHGLRHNANVIPTDTTASVLEGPLVKLGSGATQPAVFGTVLASAFTEWTAALATAGTAAAAPPNPDPTGAKYEAYAAAVTTATATLANTIANWLSGKVLVE
jgi:hypothetical protein